MLIDVATPCRYSATPRMLCRRWHTPPLLRYAPRYAAALLLPALLLMPDGAILLELDASITNICYARRHDADTLCVTRRC